MPERLKYSQKLVGVNQVRKAVLRGTTKTVFIAEDAEQRLIAPILEICENIEIQIVWVHTMKQLGKACGIKVGAAAAALISTE